MSRKCGEKSSSLEKLLNGSQYIFWVLSLSVHKNTTHYGLLIMGLFVCLPVPFAAFNCNLSYFICKSRNKSILKAEYVK